MAREIPEFKNCKYCQSVIPYSAKVCPQCRKRVKGGKLKWILILAVVLLILAFACSQGNSGGGTQKVGEVTNGQKTGVGAESASSGSGTANADVDPADSDAGNTADAAQDVQEIYHVGEVLRDGNTEIVYMASGDYASDNEFMQPKEGYKYIFLKFAFENISETEDASVSFYSFECYADGYNVDMFYGGEDDLSATLSPGRATSGYLYFEVPADAQEIEVEYETNFLTEDKITFAYEGNLDSGYVLTADATPTEGALHVGESTESKNLKITYAACYRDESGNMFIQPKDGYHYITCELEFENLSGSDLSVSSFSFDCYADGIDCKDAFFRDDNLSATMSAGKKARGTVTFEVPDNASVVEVEYDTSLWTSNRVVFSVEQ